MDLFIAEYGINFSFIMLAFKRYSVHNSFLLNSFYFKTEVVIKCFILHRRVI